MERQLHGTITAEANGWLAYVRLKDPPGISPITTVGRFNIRGGSAAGDGRGVGSEVTHADR